MYGKNCGGTDTPRLAFKMIKAEGVGRDTPPARAKPQANVVVRVGFQTGCPCAVPYLPEPDQNQPKYFK